MEQKGNVPFFEIASSYLGPEGLTSTEKEMKRNTALGAASSY